MELDLMTYILLLGLPALALFLLLRRRGFAPNLTGPRGWPLVGNALQMDSQHPHASLLAWAKQFGDIYVINLFGSPVVIVSGEDEIREVLVQKSRDFAGRPEAFRISFMTNDGLEAVALMDFTARWRARKKLLSSALRMYGDGLQRLEEISNIIIEDLVKMWNKKQGTPFNPRNDIHYAIINVILSLLCGQNLPIDHPLLKELVHYHTDVSVEVFAPTNAVELDLLPWVRFFGHKIYKKLKDFKEYHVFVTLKNLMEENKKSLDPDNLKGILHTLLLELAKIKDATGKEGNDVINPTVIISITEEIFGAGTQTTSSTLLSLIAHCALHQGFQTQLRSHISDAIGDRQPLLRDRPKLPLVEALILEVLRLMTVLPTALPHLTTVPTSVGGKELPKGIMVWPNLWALHHDERYWENPWEFNPHRFLDKEGNLVPPDHPNRKRLYPFGAGHRVCMGESLARNRLFLFVTSLIQHFRFLPAETPPNCNPRDQKLGIVLYPPAYSIIAESVV